MVTPTEAAARPAWYVYLVVMLTAVMAAGASILSSKHDQRESEQVWCDVVTVLDDAYTNPDPGSPPLTARGERLAKGIAAVGRKYDC